MKTNACCHFGYTSDVLSVFGRCNQGLRYLIVTCLLLNTLTPLFATEISVMSFNIRVPVDKAPNDWTRRKQAVVNLVKRNKPDVIGFQELVEQQQADLANVFPHYTFVGMGRKQDGTGESVNLFVNSDKFRIDNNAQGTFWFSNTPDISGSAHWGNQYLRICSWVRLINKQSGNGIYIFNNHWDFSPEFQLKGAELLMKRIAQRRHSDEPVIITGDLNAIPDAQVIQKIKSHHYSDSWQEINDQNHKLSSGATYHGFTGSAKVRIDYIFYSNHLIRLKALEVHDQSTKGIWPSDHFPISALFEY